VRRRPGVVPDVRAPAPGGRVLLQLMRRYEARGDGAGVGGAGGGAGGGARGGGAGGGARGGGARGDGAEGPAAGRPAMTLEDVLAGRGHRGTGVSSP
ncbi:MAG TPA: hypothetical protein VKU77_05130, partial [Streptosporangiaceae bacterium]|nr:hypothetical protein [Streptosporangiaceae bacterium]